MTRRRSSVPLPRDWPSHVCAAFLHAVGLAHAALTYSRAWCANSPIARVRLAGEADRLRTEVALLTEELRIKDARLARIEPRNRPHYPPAERLAILALRAARGWTAAATARRFHLTAATIAAWIRRLDEDGPSQLVRTAEPVNRFPDFVRVLVSELRAVVPAAGKVRIAQMLARAGLHLAPTTVRRMLEQRPRPPSKPTVADAAEAKQETSTDRVVTAKYPHHVWHVDFSLIPIVAGLWVPWCPFAALQRWPFCWVVGVVLDHASRAVVHAEVFAKGATAAETLSLLDSAIGISGRVPRYIVTDRGCQFGEEYRDWCARRGIRPRFGALGQHGSIAVVERFMRTLKEEAFRRLLVPFRLDAMHAELIAYVIWYNGWRPHQALGGKTPGEALSGRLAARDAPRVETRQRWPLARGDPPFARRARGLSLVVEHVEGRRHLPIVTLKRVA